MPKDNRIAPEGHVYITIGPNCWGKHKTASQSLKNAKANFPRFLNRKPLAKYFKTLCCPEKAWVDDVHGWIMTSALHDVAACPHCEVGKDKGKS
jgi:hypothetical protein